MPRPTARDTTEKVEGKNAQDSDSAAAPCASWVVYIIQCADGTLYTGITTDIARRMAAHENGTGAKYMRGRGPYTLRHTETHPDRSSASKRETAIKALSRDAKQALCQGGSDLS